MLDFLGVVIAAIIGSMLGPSFLQFLHFKKNKNQARLKYLEETYLLARQIIPFSISVEARTYFLITAMEKPTSSRSFHKALNDPTPRIYTLLDYHLKAPSIITLKIEEMMKTFSSLGDLIAESIINPKDKMVVYTIIIKNIDCMKQEAHEVAQEIINYIKTEKLIIEEKSSLFEIRYWRNVKDKIITCFIKNK